VLLALHGLPSDYSHIRDQILVSPIVPNFTSTCFTLLCVSGKYTTDITPPIDESSALVSQYNDCTHLTSRAKGVTSVTIVKTWPQN